MNPIDLDTVPSSDLEPIAPMFSHDTTQMLAQLGVESIRASLVDLALMAYRPVWGIAAHGEISHNPGTQRGDSPMPWAESMISHVENLQPEQTLVGKLSPRCRSFAWRYDDRHAAVVAVMYTRGHDKQDDAHNALVRLVCDIGIRARERTVAGSVGDEPPVVRPAVGRQRKAASKHKRPVAGAVAAILLALTLMVVALTFQRAATLQAEAERLQTLSENTMTHDLSTALATGDYGEVQAALSSFSSLGYFKGAVVTNARQRVISTAGEVGDARIGDNLLPSVVALSRIHELEQGSVRHGQLLILGADAAAAPDRSLLPLMSALVAGCAAIGAAAALFMLRYRRRSHPDSAGTMP